MRSRESANSWAPIYRVRQAGAIVIGTIALVFGLLVLIARVGFLTTTGVRIAGLTGNGLLGVISVVAGVLLIGAGIAGGRIATVATSVFGALFVLSGVFNLAVLNTSMNKLAFSTPNVLFSLVVGVVLALVGAYGVFGGQYPVAGEETDQSVSRTSDPKLAEMAQAEHAMAEGTATREQERLVMTDAQERAANRRRVAWQRYHSQRNR